ncbi:hypothetical protein MHL31_13140 [Lutibacter sp. A80]|uniref:hypothetical protein n=1 Tax=Lutibacter sp. A80 TaxID=2918453 RepID=UPI001F06FD53|nr:hypothetical protein [Lutibacter sp. A80]UMB60016.1 hypothetical protein MHL31_13140 [Lutibacter sp. A80]
MKLSKFISIFFHPINFPIIGAFIYFLFRPEYIFKPQEHTILLVILIGTYIFPIIFLLILKQYKMIRSYNMVSIEERKFPTLLFTAISIIVGNWLIKASIVDLLALLFYGYTLTFFISYVYLFFKQRISLHTAAIGGLIGFLICFSYHYQINLIVFIAFFFILSGIISSSRLKLNAHTLKEVYLGFITSLISQFIVYAIYYII